MKTFIPSKLFSEHVKYNRVTIFIFKMHATPHFKCLRICTYTGAHIMRLLKIAKSQFPASKIYYMYVYMNTFYSLQSSELVKTSKYPTYIFFSRSSTLFFYDGNDDKDDCNENFAIVYLYRISLAYFHCSLIYIYIYIYLSNFIYSLKRNSC